MPAGIPLIDILIFAIIAIFLGLRLRSVLGKRTGFEQDFSRQQGFDDADQDDQLEPAEVTTLNGDGVSALMSADPNFDESAFIDGATAAYGMILKAFADGDLETLKPLLGYEMNIGFADAIRERLKADEVLSIDLKSIDRAEVKGAKLRDGVAAITVEFASQQQRLLKAADGTVLDGDAETVENFVDRWTFERDISSTDPTWLLVETETVQ
jgi:predicted lipid-binding transport protein (Tim44 family)